jgi:hypothetical protein
MSGIFDELHAKKPFLRISLFHQGNGRWGLHTGCKNSQSDLNPFMNVRIFKVNVQF